MTAVDLLDCTVMPYAWGSRTAIASLSGRASPSDGPEAELWMGAHPVAPSKASRDGVKHTLDAIIAREPERELGAAAIRAFGPRLPFLLKVLAASEPLSLQAHPTMEQAKAGFADEEARGVPREAAHRNYKDPSHKPELLCALGPFDALSGFRAIDATIALFDHLAVRALDGALAPLRAARDAKGLAETFRLLMTMPAEKRAPIVESVVAACSLPSPKFPRERALAERLAKLYPGDVGVVSALLLELVHLEAGDAIYLDAGNLHAYVEGTGVEIMASSDNVLRGGLTKKHVDVPALLRCLDFEAGPAKVLRPREVDACEHVYDTPAKEFRLSRIVVSAPVVRTTFGPEILLTTEGSVSAGHVAAPRGAAVFVPAATGRYTLGGDGVVFRATTNLAP
ncbi:MAG: mannose-6-phosphate isomerase, class I [Labilithrix sp.]|nr:mannose-6-phosphate isomerase, class I [Labilithrix sp.]MCW5811884.1 mannose-6-phosphate isomerase, class I [Labilithrix sp.]